MPSILQCIRFESVYLKIVRIDLRRLLEKWLVILQRKDQDESEIIHECSNENDGYKYRKGDGDREYHEYRQEYLAFRENSRHQN